MLNRGPALLLWILLMGLAIVVIAACRSGSEPIASSSDPVQTRQFIDQADKLYAQRSDLNRVREAIVLLRQAQAADFGSYDAAWRLAQCEYYLGDNSTSESERVAAFTQGIKDGELAITLNSGKPEGHFWLGVNLGLQSEMKGMLSTLTTIPDIRREMEAVIRLDDRYMGGSAYLALGRIELELPEFLGGNRQRAVDYLEKGLIVDDENHQMMLLLAKAYLAVDRKQDARRQLDKIFQLHPDPRYLPEYIKSVTGARELVSKRF